jgi:hypothetical protein
MPGTARTFIGYLFVEGNDMRLRIFTVITLALLTVSVSIGNSLRSKAPAPNTLTKAERAAGWRLLFDGKTLNGWRGFHEQQMPSAWSVTDGTLHKALILVERNGKNVPAEGTDIITLEQFENFELQLEWKLAKGGNSGIKYLVQESLPPQGAHAISFEMQILDDEYHPDAKMGSNGNRTAGSLYDLIPAKNKVLKPVGEFNHVRLVKKGGHVEHWLNHIKVLEFEIGSEALKSRIAESKFKNTAGFGEAKKGHILIQDHGDPAWFRNIKIRELQ